MLYVKKMLYTLRVFGAVPWLIQDLDPDDLPLNLVATHEPDIVVQVLLAVERLDPAAVSTQPVLCIYSYFHIY